MTGPQATLIGAAFVILLAITAAVQRKWLRPGRVQTVLVFLCGVATVAALWVAGIPPAWFSGTKTAFGLAGSLSVSAFLTGEGEARAFGLPLLLSMGLALFAANVAHLIRGAL